MKNKSLILFTICLLIFNILLLNINYNQKKIIKNNIFQIADQEKKMIIKNDSLRDKILYFYYSNVFQVNMEDNMYDKNKQKILREQFINNKLIVVIPESLCSSCFYHKYNEILNSFSTSLKSKICLVKSVKEISRAVLDDTDGVEFYIEDGFGLEIEKYNFPYVLCIDKDSKIKFTFLFDINHPSTFVNAVKYYESFQILDTSNNDRLAVIN